MEAVRCPAVPRTRFVLAKESCTPPDRVRAEVLALIRPRCTLPVSSAKVGSWLSCRPVLRGDVWLAETSLPRDIRITTYAIPSAPHRITNVDQKSFDAMAMRKITPPAVHQSHRPEDCAAIPSPFRYCHTVTTNTTGAGQGHRARYRHKTLAKRRRSSRWRVQEYNPAIPGTLSQWFSDSGIEVTGWISPTPCRSAAGGRTLCDQGSRPWLLGGLRPRSAGKHRAETWPRSSGQLRLQTRSYSATQESSPRDRTGWGEGQPIPLATRTPSAEHESRRHRSGPRVTWLSLLLGSGSASADASALGCGDAAARGATKWGTAKPFPRPIRRPSGDRPRWGSRVCGSVGE